MPTSPICATAAAGRLARALEGPRAARAAGPEAFAALERHTPGVAAALDLHARRPLRARRGGRLDQPLGLYRRGRVRDFDPGRRSRADRRLAVRRAGSKPSVSARAIRCGSKPGCRSTATISTADRSGRGGAGLGHRQAPPRAKAASPGDAHRRHARRGTRAGASAWRSMAACPRARARGRRRRGTRSAGSPRAAFRPPSAIRSPWPMSPPPTPRPARRCPSKSARQARRRRSCRCRSSPIAITAKEPANDPLFHRRARMDRSRRRHRHRRHHRSCAVPARRHRVRRGARGRHALAKGKEAAVVESVKAASDVYSPISGTVTEGNAAIEDDPALVNSDAEGAGWFFKLTIWPTRANSTGLMDEGRLPRIRCLAGLIEERTDALSPPDRCRPLGDARRDRRAVDRGPVRRRARGGAARRADRGPAQPCQRDGRRAAHDACSRRRTSPPGRRPSSSAAGPIATMCRRASIT